MEKIKHKGTLKQYSKDVLTFKETELFFHEYQLNNSFI